MADTSSFSAENLKEFMREALRQTGVGESDAAAAADSMLLTEIQGSSSHGLMRFPVYFRRLQDKLINPQPQMTVTAAFPSVISLNGDNGLGAVVMARALSEGIKAAAANGIAAVGVSNSNHFGAAGYYCSLAAEAGYISILFTNGPPAIAPWGGKEPYFGTNPVAFGLPRRDGSHVVIDMSSSIVARGKIIEAAKAGTPIPDGWALDADGNPTNDATQALAGVVLPMAGPKGYALALAVEHLAGVLTGAGFGRSVANQNTGGDAAANVGHLLIILRTDVFGDNDKYMSRMETFCEEIHNIAAAPEHSGVRLPGEQKWDLAKARLAKEIKLQPHVRAEFEKIAEELGLEIIYRYRIKGDGKIDN